MIFIPINNANFDLCYCSGLVKNLAHYKTRPNYSEAQQAKAYHQASDPLFLNEDT